MYIYLCSSLFGGQAGEGQGENNGGGQKILDSNIIDKYIQIAKALQSKK